MDFMSFKKDLSEQFGIDDINLSYLNKIRIVRFDVDERENISGKIQEGIVYRHRDFENVIKAGDMWVCLLQENIKCNRQYFAKPIQKVDAAFIYELTSNQMEEMAQYIWKNYRDSIDGILKDEYSVAIEKMASEMAEEITKRNQEEIDSLNIMIKTLKETNQKLQEGLDLADKSVLELKETLEQEKAIKVGCQNEIVLLRSQLNNVKEEFSLRKDCNHVIRTAPNQIYSEALENGNYSVYVTANKSRMLIEKNERGKLICENNTLRLYGFENILPFEKEEKLVYTSDKEGKMTIILPERIEA